MRVREGSGELVAAVRRIRLSAWLGGMAAALLSTGCFDAASGLSDRDDARSRTIEADCLTPEDEVRMADRVLELINLERAESGRTPLLGDSRLQRAASNYACSMIEGDFFDHFDPASQGPADRAYEAGYPVLRVGENLAAGQETPADAVRTWMESPPHRKVLLGYWKHVGVGVRSGGRYGTYWVLEVGEPADY